MDCNTVVDLQVSAVMCYSPHVMIYKERKRRTKIVIVLQHGKKGPFLASFQDCCICIYSSA